MLLNLVMSNTNIQWTGENTRFKGHEEASRLKLLFTKQLDITEEINYQCSFGKSDHLLLEYKLGKSLIENRSKIYKSERYNYRKVNFIRMMKFLVVIDWKQLFTMRNTQENGIHL